MLFETYSVPSYSTRFDPMQLKVFVPTLFFFATYFLMHCF
jgi:hypothetical protein